MIVNLMSAVWETLKLLFSMGLAALSSIWETAWGGISDFFMKIWDEIVSFITGLPGQAFQWGSDFINGLAEGIMSGGGVVVDAVKGVGEKIKSFLHFSVPDEGPLTDYESWMPDFMGGLADGIQANRHLVIDQVKGLVDGISVLIQAAIAQPATAAESMVSNISSSVTQNVNISNSYSGGSQETQRNVSKAMKKSASDATTYMARGLAYARG